MSPKHTAIFEGSVTRIVTAVEQGPPGPPGPAVPAGTPSFIAGMDLIAFRLVALANDGRMLLGDNREIESASTSLGLVLTSPLENETAPVQRTGIVTNGGWNWQASQKLFLGTEGALITAPPAAPATFSLPVALAIASDKVIINIGLAIAL